MRNRIGFSIVCLTCFLLVAATKSDRYVKDNVFYSSSPKLEARVDPKFKYLGGLDYTMEQQSPDNLQLVAYETKSYVFVDSIENKLKRAVYVQLRVREFDISVLHCMWISIKLMKAIWCAIEKKE